MNKLLKYFFIGANVVGIAVAMVMLVAFAMPDDAIEGILADYDEEVKYDEIEVTYPFDKTLFPPDIAPPTFHWKDEKSGADSWLIAFKFQDDSKRMSFLADKQEWTPAMEDWEVIKKLSMEKIAKVALLGIKQSEENGILSAGRISISTSKDEVGAPIFYREVNLPFVDAVKDPSLIRWRFGAISSLEQPPVVLDNLPVCGNCHSFTADGKTLAMDVDYANSKGSYVITRVKEDMILASSDIITWDKYRPEDMEQTFGLLSQISPDGTAAVSTVKDRSVFVPRDDLAYSQLFFPIKGILCTYDRHSGTFRSLPGADDPKYVQSDPTWSPDGKYIVFAKSEAYKLKHSTSDGKVLLTREECAEFLRDGKLFIYDLYRVPYNNGKGGKAEPLKGASNNGMSNYFAKYSPDGKWIVFCKAKSYSLLQPDSELYIIPAEGGEARRLECNTARMNSWHSWSPNSKWLVFSSKLNGPYTQLLLTHIDENGHSSPPVVLSNFTASDRAANIPEFVNNKPTAINKIHEKFLNDYSYVRAGNEFFKAGEADNAIKEYNNALELNPDNIEAHLKLGFLKYNVLSKYKEGMEHYGKAFEIEPNDPRVHHDLGMALLHQGDNTQAIKHLSEALRIIPDGISKQYNAADMNYNLGLALFRDGQIEESTVHLFRAADIEPKNSKFHYYLAMVLAAQGEIKQTLEHYEEAVRIEPAIDNSPTIHDLLGMSYAKAGQFQNAILSAEKALEIAKATGKTRLAQDIEMRIGLYKQNKVYNP